ncbi:NADPH dehydrogenase [Xylariaceae sp. FL1272]|nr:NADPH dehydrogenase [Xylariaceae sp. FL1272]
MQDPPAGSALDLGTAPTLFQPLQIRGMKLQNRFAVAPMCQYSAQDGHLTDWHFAHLSQYAIRGAALTIVEATAVLPNGRISPQDSGLWKDSQMAPLKRIVDFSHSQGQKIGIQLAHAGRKASTVAPWLRPTGSQVAPLEHGGWPDVWAPSALKFSEAWCVKHNPVPFPYSSCSRRTYANFCPNPDPEAMTTENIHELVLAFKEAARRSVKAGFDCIEIHGAHGYLITEFLSPISNTRTDTYGGSFENRTRLLFDVIAAVREVVPDTMPVFLRLSATEWMEYDKSNPGWTIEDSIRLAKLLPAAGIDLLDVSSGGNNESQRINLHSYYQVDLAGQIREDLQRDGLKLLIGAVGMITNAEMARSIVQEGNNSTSSGPMGNDSVEIVEEVSGHITKADLVLAARQFLREPEFTLRVAHQLGVEVQWPVQYSRAGWPKSTNA